MGLQAVFVLSHERGEQEEALFEVAIWMPNERIAASLCYFIYKFMFFGLLI